MIVLMSMLSIPLVNRHNEYALYLYAYAYAPCF